MGSWVDLPEDILEIISEKLCHSDLSEVGVVCKPWRSTYLKFYSRHPKNIPLSVCQVPLLLLSCKEYSKSRKYAVFNDKSKSGEIFLPEAKYHSIRGSSWGWLIITTSSFGQCNVTLLNLFTRNQIKLPSLLATFTKRTIFYGFEHIYKAIISHDPVKSQQDCVVMAIVGNTYQLSFCKIGDEKWTNVEGYPQGLEDVIYSGGRFFAVNCVGNVVSFDGKNIPNSKEMMTITKNPEPMYPCPYPRRYLVVSSGRLLQVCRIFEFEWVFNEDGSFRDEIIKTRKFNSFMLVKRESPFIISRNGARHPRNEEICHDWVKVEDIGDHVLLLGNNASLSLQLSTYNNCKANCIHFTGNHFDGPIDDLLSYKYSMVTQHEIGTFDIAEGSIRNDLPNDLHHDIPSV